MAKILIYSKSNLSKDSRVNRQIIELSKQHEVICAGFKTNPPLDCEIIKIDELVIDNPVGEDIFQKMLYSFKKHGISGPIYFLLKRIFEALDAHVLYTVIEKWLKNKKVIQQIRGIECDLIIANELSSLNVICPSCNKARVLFDAHEYSPGKYGGKKRVFRERQALYLLHKYIGKAKMVTTVAEGIADLYEKEFTIPRPVVITNAPSYISLKPVGISGEFIRLVHHGKAIERRQIENLVYMMDDLDERFSLDFYLVPTDQKFYNHLLAIAGNNKNIRFNKPVSLDRLAFELNKYDVGVHILPPINLNHVNALPNKLFEFIQARLALAVSPSPEMVKYIRKYDIGIVSKDFTAKAMASELFTLKREDIMRFKENCHKNAYELSAEPQMKLLGDVVDLCLKA